MNVSRGLNRLWVLLTVLWFVGVASHIWLDYTHDEDCRHAVEELDKKYLPHPSIDQYSQNLPPGCTMFDDYVPPGGELLFLLRQNAWALAVPVIVW
jgi:hypothetical protein